jgi:hypothetical protein
MSSPLKFVLTSSSSQPSRLGDGLVPSDSNIGVVRGGLPPENARQVEEVDAHEAVIEQQKRAKQICDADRERFRQFYDDELRRKRPKQFLYRERPPAREGVESNKATQERLRARQEQRVKDDQLRESRRLAKQRAWQEQRVKDDDQDGDNIDASRFTAGDKVAVQAWFGSYVFTNKSGKAMSGPTFRLLKLWRLQVGVSGPSGLNSSPVTKRRRIL